MAHFLLAVYYRTGSAPRVFTLAAENMVCGQLFVTYKARHRRQFITINDSFSALFMSIAFFSKAARGEKYILIILFKNIMLFKYKFHIKESESLSGQSVLFCVNK
jgi:hypothetical protein